MREVLEAREISITACPGPAHTLRLNGCLVSRKLNVVFLSES